MSEFTRTKTSLSTSAWPCSPSPIRTRPSPSRGTGGYRGQMAVLVKPNGLLGTAYTAAIMPFRHRILYPSLIREIGRDWRAGKRLA